MRITKLHLSGYTRILLNNIRSITLTPESMYQFILGTNGSGKSSILSELSPLPGKPSDFSRGGCKIIEITHHNHHYVLTSTFGPKPEHLFEKDGVNLNDGRTITVQRDLVLQEFNITEEIFNLMLGKTRFTQMSPTKRRDLISQMSDQDFTYAFKLYKDLTTIARDQQGTIKHLKQRVTKETEKLRTLEGDRTHLTEQVNALQNELTDLMETRRSDLGPSHEVQRQLKQWVDELDTVSTAVLKRKLPIEFTEYDNREALDADIRTIESTLSSNRELVTHYAEEHEKLGRLIEDDTSGDVKSLPQLEAERDALTQQRAELMSKDVGFVIDANPRDVLAIIPELKPQLVDVLSTLPDNSDTQFSRTHMEATKTKLYELRHQLESLDSKLNRINRELADADMATAVECPSCKHSWKPGVHEEHLTKLKKVKSTLEAEHTTLDAEYKVLIERKEQLENYGVQLNRFRTLSYNYPLAQSLFSWLTTDNRIMYQPSQYVPVIERWEYAVRHWVAIKDIDAKLDTLVRTIDHVKTMEQHGGDRIHTRLHELDIKLGDLYQAIDELTQRHTHLVAIGRQWTQHVEDVDRVARLYRQIESGYQEYISRSRNESVGGLIREHQSELAMLTHRLNECQSVESVVDDLTVSLDGVTEDHAIYKALAKAMSPTEGVIARQISSFIQHMTDQINDIIQQIYSYPMHVLPCGVSSGDLDYKFPMLVGADQNPVGDVGEGSDGQQEVIDLAFKMTALLYLGYDDYPLYLDEPGRRQDEQHGVNLINYIKMVVGAHRYSQLFMISHFAASYGGFSQAEYLVLNGTNITVPQHANQHVVIE